MPSKKAPKPPPRRCLFCGGSGLTEEHFWGDWAAKLFPRTSHDKRLISIYDFKGADGRPAEPTERQVRSGHTVKWVQKVVCGTCNNGWMGTIENRAIPILLDITKSAPRELSDEDRSNLALWITLKNMISETMLPQHAVWSSADYEAFYKTRQIPRSISIWLAQCIAPKWDATLFEHSTTMGSSLTPYPDDTRKNVKTITIRFGDLRIFSLISPIPELHYLFGEAFGEPIVPLYPFRVPPKPWPPVRDITPEEGETLARALEGFQGSKHFSLRNPYTPEG